MLEYLKKFNNLPPGLKEKVSSKPVMATIENLEQKYKIALAALIMKVMVKEIALPDLDQYLLKENLTEAKAGELAQELKQKIFLTFGDYFSAKAEPELRVKGASFFFSPEDEAEIRELAKNISASDKIELSAEAIADKLREIIDGAQINFGSAELADRFKQIQKTFLRGIRNRLETKLTLIKSFDNGGLSFDEDSAEKVMALADKILNAKPGQPMAAPPKIKLPELEKKPVSAKPAPAVKEIAERDAPYDFSRLKKSADKIKQDLKKLDTAHELNAPAKAAPVSVAKQEISQLPLIKRRFEAENLSQSPKAKIEDVKYVPKVMGPIDEIKYMDLTAWRRLSNDPAKTAQKIINKMELLQEEGYGKRLEAIKAWRLSPIFKLYLEIGGLSISENKPIDVIIEERKMAGQEYLTADEFRAVMDLNKSLRY